MTSFSRRISGRGSIAVLVFLAVATLLAAGHRDVGYVRDEGIYFEASRDHARWLAEVAADPRRLADADARDRSFAINHEHPALMKVLAGVSARALAPASASSGSWPSEGAAMRFPAQCLAALGAAMLFWAASGRAGTWGGLLATGFVFALPRVWFHAGLHAFDVPVMVATLAVALAYLRALSDPRWGAALGPLLGVAIAIKHNALFLAPLLTLHLVWCVFRAQSASPLRSRLAYVAWPLWSMACLAPATAIGLWPWLWHATASRLANYFAFHAQHNWYNMEFLGVNYNQPPMPFAYPWVMTWATVPTALLVLALVGLLWHRPTPAGGGSGGFWAPVGPAQTREGTLWLLLGLFPFILIAWPTTPIFGGTKHWLTAYPFLALAAAQAWDRLWTKAATPRRRLLEPCGVVLLLAPSIWATVHGHPYNLSQYAPMVGGARGAANIGLNRGFWGHAVLPLLPEIPANTDAPLCLGDLHALVQKQYEREGRWPPSVSRASLARCRSGLHFYERHMLRYELEYWDRFGTSAPHRILTLDDVPLTSLYTTTAH